MRARRDWFWLALLCLVATLLPDSAAGGLEYRRDAVLSGELWRLLTGHFVHYSLRQALQDGCALALLAYALESIDGPRNLLPRLGLSAVVLSLLLVIAVPAMAGYRGASGLAMVLAGMLLRALWRAHPAWRPGLAAIAVLLCGKMLADALGYAIDFTGLPLGVRVAWQVHAAGLVLGVLPEKFSGRAAA